jgi:hypothetical protein
MCNRTLAGGSRGQRGMNKRAILFALLVHLLVPCSYAQAHKLNGDYQSRVVQKVRVESYFSDDSRPAGATIQVFRLGESAPFLEDKLNDQGEYEFYADAEPLRVVILAGEGHQKELLIESKVKDTSAPLQAIEHKVDLPVQQILIGIALLLGGGAFLLSWRNAKVLSRNQRQ